MDLSRRARTLHGSPTIGAAERVRGMLAQNEDVIRFDIGEPDFDTPAHIKEAGIAAIRSGFTHYTSGRGIPELRDALVGDQRSKGLDAGPSNIAFYPGSKLGLFCALSLLVDRGDEVLVQDPVWPSYGSIVEYLGGRPVEVQSWKDDQPSVRITEAFESRITDRTRAVIINTPCNPTGAIVGHDILEELVRVCTARKVTLILDRIYSALTYDGSPEKIPSANLEDGYFVVVSGFSKEFAMTGWRLGYTIASRALTDALVNLQDNTSTCAPSFVQKAGVAALTGDRGWQKAMNSEYRARRDLMVDGIRKVPGWNCQPPQGAFYCFPRVADSESIALADSLLSKKKVSSVAGAYFGSSGESHLRLSYTTSRDRIAEGMKRIRDLVEGQGPV